MEIQITESKPDFLVLGNTKPYLRCEPLNNKEAIVFDKYRFEIVELHKACRTNVKGLHRARSKSPAAHMSNLQRLLAMRDSIVHVTFANKILTVLTCTPEVYAFDFGLNELRAYPSF